MYASLLLLTLAFPARAGVVVSLEAGASAPVPAISLQTALSPSLVPALASALQPALQGSLAAPSIPNPAARIEPAALLVEKPGFKPQALIPRALTPALSAASAGDAPNGPSGLNMFDGAAPRAEAELPVFGFQEGATTVEPTGLAHRLKKALSKLAGAASPPLLYSLYDDNSRKHYYHGLSLGTLEKAIDGGGSLKAGLTFVSDEAGHPYGYARSSARQTGTAGVVLQFDMAPLEALIVPGHYNPRAPERGEKWEDVPHWFRAEKDIPLTAQTELSKKTVLNWLAEQRDARPENASWTEKIAKFEAAFGAKAPPPKPKDPAATAAASLGLDGLSLKGGKWRKDGKILSRLGRGSIGFVDVHPTRPGLVVKTIDPSLDQLLGGLSLAEAIKHDEASAAALAAAGIGPRVLGAAEIEGRRVTVRERVHGKTMRDLITDHAFGAEEEALVLDMVRRMAENNLLVSDLKPENIMLGTIERDGVRRAWFVDGGVVESFEPGLDAAAREQKLLDYPNVIGMWEDRNSRQVIEKIRTLRDSLANGREDSAMSPWRLFFKRLGQAFLMSGLGAANK